MGRKVHIDIERAIGLYAQEGNLERTANLLGVDDSTLRLRFLQHGVKLNAHAGKKIFKINQDYFNIIDSEPKAYWLGFLFADGNVYCGKQGYKLTVNLARKDRCLIEGLLLALEANNPIRDTIYTKLGKGFKKCEYQISSGVISSKKLILDLISLGCVPRKSLVLQFPKLRNDLERHFIRGYFDGDGCICLSKIKGKVRKNWNWSLLGTKQLLGSVQQILVTCCGLKRTKVSKTNKIYKLSYGGRINVLKISNFLYEEATVWLERKAIKMKQSEIK